MFEDRVLEALAKEKGLVGVLAQELIDTREKAEKYKSWYLEADVKNEELEKALNYYKEKYE